MLHTQTEEVKGWRDFGEPIRSIVSHMMKFFFYFLSQKRNKQSLLSNAFSRARARGNSRHSKQPKKQRSNAKQAKNYISENVVAHSSLSLTFSRSGGRRLVSKSNLRTKNFIESVDIERWRRRRQRLLQWLLEQSVSVAACFFLFRFIFLLLLSHSERLDCDFCVFVHFTNASSALKARVFRFCALCSSTQIHSSIDFIPLEFRRPKIVSNREQNIIVLFHTSIQLGFSRRTKNKAENIWNKKNKRKKQ